MDDDDQDSNASSDREQDEAMEEAEDGDNDAEGENDDNDDNDDEGDDDDNDDNDDDDDENEDREGNDARTPRPRRRPPPPELHIKPPTPSSTTSPGTPFSSGPQPVLRARPEAVTARLYDIVPTMAAPMSTSINALSVTPDLRFCLTGGSDGYVRKYDGPGTINGKLPLTVAQRHPFVDSVTKAGILMSYWENEEPPSVVAAGPGKSAAAAGADDHVLSPVYSLAVHSQAVWVLSGLESGGINIHSVRYDEGKCIACLQKHTSPVSALQLSQDEKSFLSGGWDKAVLDWDLNTGDIIRSFEGCTGQIAAIEVRPASGAPVPAEAALEVKSMSNGIVGLGGGGGGGGGSGDFGGPTFSSNNGLPPKGNGSLATGGGGGGVGGGVGDVEVPPPPPGVSGPPNGGMPAEVLDANGIGVTDFAAVPPSPGGNESLFGGSDAGSLFGDTGVVGSVGDMDGGGGGGGGGDGDGGVFGDGYGDLHLGDRTPEAPGGGDSGNGSAAAAAAAAAAESHRLDSTADGPMVGIEQHNSDAMELDGDGGAPGGRAVGMKNGVDGLPDGRPIQVPPSSSSAPAAPASQGAAAGASSSSSPAPPAAAAASPSPLVISSSLPEPAWDATQTSHSSFLTASIDGTLRIWDRRAPNAVARINPGRGVPPWSMGACWSPDGNWIYVGRRNSAVEEYSVHRASSQWASERTLRFPQESGPVSAVRAMANGRHLLCASHDILRLYDLQDQSAFKHASVPFLIVPGPPRPGTISHIYIDPTARFMITTAGTRGWETTSTEVLIGYEIGVVSDG